MIVGDHNHRLITLNSRASIELPLSALIDEGTLDVYPHVEANGLLFLQFRRGQVIITAGKYIGLIPLSPNISLEVRPKLPVSNLAHVLDRARSSLQSLEKVDRLYEATDGQGTTVLEFLLSNLVDALAPIRSSGLLKDYVRRTETMSHPRGRINLVGTLQTCWSRGQRHLVKADRFEQTADLAPNRVLKHALEYALTALQRVRGDAAIVARANEAHRELPAQISQFRTGDLDWCHDAVRGRKLSHSRAYYYRAIEIALLILSRRSISLDRTGADILMQTFILDFENVFEAYLRRILQGLMPGSVTVKDGNGAGKKALYDDRVEPYAQPDMVIQGPAGPPLIAEVKYKDRPDRGDVNQAVTYAACYRSSVVTLVHQCRAGAPAGLQLIGTIDGVRVYGYAYNLAADDLLEEELRFRDALLGLLSPQPDQLAA